MPYTHAVHLPLRRTAESVAPCGAQVMTNSSYLERELASIPEAKRQAMRRCLAKHAERLTFSNKPSEHDAAAMLVKHMLGPGDTSILATCDEFVSS